HRRLLQVGEVLVELLGEQHSLVDDGLEGKAGQVPVLGAVDGGSADLAIGTLADHIELALELHLILDRRVAPDEDLPDERLGGLGSLAEGGVVRRHGAPAEERLPFGLDVVLEYFHQPGALVGLRGRKTSPLAYSP